MITFEYQFGKKKGIATDVDELIKQMDELESTLSSVGEVDYKKAYKTLKRYLTENKNEVMKQKQ